MPDYGDSALNSSESFVHCHRNSIGLSKRAHLEYDADHEGFERRHGVTHAELVKKQWEGLGVIPGPWMYEGMAPRRAEWMKRVMQKLF